MSPKAPFPVSHSNLAAGPLGVFVKEQYAIAGEVFCKLIRSGINDTYLIQGQETQYVFRVYSLNWRTRTEILEEIRLLNLLKSYQIAISFPIADKQNDYVQILNAPEGDRFGVLFSFANGDKIQKFSPDVHRQIGQIMGRIHQVTNTLSVERVSYTPKLLLEDSLEQVAQFLSDSADEMTFMKSTQAFLLAELSAIDFTQIRTGVVHLDIWFDNLNIDQEGNVTIFDFDFCGNGWLCLDLAYYMMQVYDTEREEAECQLKLNSFFEGYESIVSIRPEEKRILPALGVSLYFFYLGVQCQRFENWSNVFLSESYLKRFINALVKRYFGIHFCIKGNGII